MLFLFCAEALVAFVYSPTSVLSCCISQPCVNSLIGIFRIILVHSDVQPIPADEQNGPISGFVVRCQLPDGGSHYIEVNGADSLDTSVG